MSYDKYDKEGAYHWRHTHPGARFWRYSPRLAANYAVAQRRLLDRLSCGPEQARVLDLACGDGVMTYRMSREGVEVIGLDFMRIALDLAREKTRAHATDPRFVQASAYSLPFADATFDGVTAMELIEHLEPALTDVFLAEIRRVLKPNGIILITTPQRKGPVLMSPYHTQEFSGPELKACLEKTFANVEVHGYFKPEATRTYERGGALLRPFRLVWKALAQVGLYNPFAQTTSTPQLGIEENIIGVGTKTAATTPGTKTPAPVMAG